MANLNIKFNNKNYSIDSALLTDALTSLEGHLVAMMDEPAEPVKKFKTIVYDDSIGGAVEFCAILPQMGATGVDEAVLPTKTDENIKISDASEMHFYYIEDEDDIFAYANTGETGYIWVTLSTSFAFMSYLGTITDISQATEPGYYALIYTDTPEERLEGDGAEFYTLAPTALSFRSTAPLNELQEVQINGVTVDPSNYTLEEGSTIVTFSIDYLKTLNVGSYEVAIASESKTVKGGFTVAAPELNEHGFYYNQPYVGYVSAVNCEIAFFVRDDGTFDSIAIGANTESGTYEISNNTIIAVSPLFGQLNCTISSNGTEIFCNELATNFVLASDNSIAADEDYIYTYQEDLGGYEVKCIDKTKAEYGAIKTGINGIDTVKLGDYMFSDNYDLIAAPIIPDGITVIGERAFINCVRLPSVEIPASVESIGDRAFGSDTNYTGVGYSSLTTIVFAEGSQLATIGEGAFWNCSSLTSVAIPDSVTSIGDYAFSYCSSLTSIVIPDSVTSIGERVFYGCAALTIVEIGDSVTSIGEEAFSGCGAITSIVIPDSVTSIGDSALCRCFALTKITFTGTIEQWNAITKLSNVTADGVPVVTWNQNVPATHVHCTDGDVAL